MIFLLPYHGAGAADLTVVFDETSVPGSALYLDERLAVVFDDPRPSGLLALLHRADALDAATLRVKSAAPAP